MKEITAVIIGAGARGIKAYVSNANPGTLRIVGVAEPDDFRRNLCAERFSIPSEGIFKSYEELLSKERMAELAIICTDDRMHVEPARMAVEKGYHVILEKPISPVPEEVYEIGKLAEKSDKVFSICHVLRYTKLFTKLKSLIESGRIGKLVHIIHSENVGYWHFSNSFVRGKRRNSNENSPMILQKCCHDMDILLYLVGSRCKSISSCGALSYFKEENAPKGAPMRCTDGCPAYDKCPYNAVSLYVHGVLRPKCEIQFRLPEVTDRTIIEALKENQWGRCVYHCDNNVADHQSVSIEFENGVTASFSVCGFAETTSRYIRIMGSHGEIVADLAENSIEVRDFTDRSKDKITIKPFASGHSGGDHGFINSVLAAIRGEREDRSSAQESVESHFMAFAAEKSRTEGKTIKMDEFIAEMRENPNK